VVATVTEAIWLAVISAVAPTLTVILATKQQNKKLENIHVLVNGRLATALKEIEKLKREIKDLKEEK
jgi:hypothetical protein